MGKIVSSGKAHLAGIAAVVLASFLPLCSGAAAQSGMLMNNGANVTPSAGQVSIFADSSTHRLNLINYDYDSAHSARVVAFWPCSGSTNVYGLLYAGPIPATYSTPFESCLNTPASGTGVLIETSGSAPTWGTLTGNTTTFATFNGTTTAGDSVSLDTNGNLQDSGNPLSRLLYAYSVQTNYTAPTVAKTCSGTCATNYVYKIDILDAYGNIVASSASSTTLANASTLDASHYNTITCPSTFATFDGNTPTCTVYRTTGGAAQGSIATGVALGAVTTDNPLTATTTSTADTLVSNGATVNICGYTVKQNILGTGNRNITATAVFTRNNATNTTFAWSYGGNVLASVGSTSTNNQYSTLRFGNNPGVTGTQWGMAANLPTKAGQTGTDSTMSKTLAYTFNVAGTSDTVNPGGCDIELAY